MCWHPTTAALPLICFLMIRVNKIVLLQNCCPHNFTSQKAPFGTKFSKIFRRRPQTSHVGGELPPHPPRTSHTFGPLRGPRCCYAPQWLLRRDWLLRNLHYCHGPAPLSWKVGNYAFFCWIRNTNVKFWSLDLRPFQCNERREHAEHCCQVNCWSSLIIFYLAVKHS